MIDHLAINVSDLARSRAFYEAALAPLGYVVRRVHASSIGFGATSPQAGDDPGGDFWIAHGQPFAAGVHLAFRAANHQQVDAFYQAALAAGGQDNGAPGLRPRYHALLRRLCPRPRWLQHRGRGAYSYLKHRSITIRTRAASALQMCASGSFCLIFAAHTRPTSRCHLGASVVLPTCRMAACAAIMLQCTIQVPGAQPAYPLCFC